MATTATAGAVAAVGYSVAAGHESDVALMFLPLSYSQANSMLAQGEQAVGIGDADQLPQSAEEVAAAEREQDRKDVEAAILLLQRMAAEGRLPAGLQAVGLDGSGLPHGTRTPPARPEDSAAQ